MSFSRPRLENPAKKFIEWKSDDRQFSYYDKETEKNVPLPLPVYFIVLDELSCITGFCEKHKTNIFSNEVRSTTTEPLMVRTFKGGERIVGLYQAIKDEAKALGGKYTKSVFALLLMPGQEPELVNFRFRGSANSAWIDKKVNTEKYIICVKESLEEKKGATVYNVPIFSKVNLTPEHRAAATKMDFTLQAYLKEYFDQQEDTIAAVGEVAEQPTYLANIDAQLAKAADEIRAQHPGNALLDTGFVKADRAAALAKKVFGTTSDPALLDPEPAEHTPSEDGVDDLPF